MIFGPVKCNSPTGHVTTVGPVFDDLIAYERAATRRAREGRKGGENVAVAQPVLPNVPRVHGVHITGVLLLEEHRVRNGDPDTSIIVVIGRRKVQARVAAAISSRERLESGVGRGPHGARAGTGIVGRPGNSVSIVEVWVLPPRAGPLDALDHVQFVPLSG